MINNSGGNSAELSFWLSFLVIPEHEKVNAGSPPFRRAGSEAALGHEGRLSSGQLSRTDDCERNEQSDHNHSSFIGESFCAP